MSRMGVFIGRAMVQAVVRWLLTTKVRVRSQASFVFMVVRVAVEQTFLPSVSFLLFRYHSTSAPFLSHLPPSGFVLG